MPRIRIALAVTLALACTRTEHRAAGPMTLSSPAFANNAAIPAKYTCDGANVSPPLTIAGVPTDAKSLALTVDDPDAPGGSFTHWLVWKIPPSTTTIAEGQHLGTEEQNGFGKPGYGGPCPPSGIHHYHFKLYALDSKLELTEKADKKAIEEKMHGHILEQAELIGLFSK